MFRITHLYEQFYSRCFVCFILCFCLLLNIRPSSNNIDKLDRKKTTDTAWFVKLYWQWYSNIWKDTAIIFCIDPMRFLKQGGGVIPLRQLTPSRHVSDMSLQRLSYIYWPIHFNLTYVAVMRLFKRDIFSWFFNWEEFHWTLKKQPFGGVP